MKIAFACALVVASTVAASAQFNSRSNSGSSNSFGYGTGSNSSSHSSSGYTNNHGTYVQPHQSTNPNNTQADNYGSRGNVNPYTGAVGTRTPRY